jgi:hypothetical protein
VSWIDHAAQRFTIDERPLRTGHLFNPATSSIMAIITTTAKQDTPVNWMRLERTDRCARVGLIRDDRVEIVELRKQHCRHRVTGGDA